MSTVPAFDLPDRNALARKTIGRYAWKHVKQDALIDLGGIVGGFFVPGAGYAALGASVVAGLPVYQGLARDLSFIYQAPRDLIVNRLNVDHLVLDAGLTVGVGAAALVGQEFLLEIAAEVLHEIGLSSLTSFIPVVGGVAAAGLGVAIAATMTWRIGAMTVLYYQFGGKWINDRPTTWERGKAWVGGLGVGTSDR